MTQRVWFITGISSGLGQSLSAQVLEKGDFLIGTFRNENETKRFNESNSRDKALAVTLDLSKPEMIYSVSLNILREFPSIDVLVNNAGYGFVGAIEEASQEEWKELFQVNFFSSIELTKSLLPALKALGKGNILMISSHAGFQGSPGFGVYNASKFAMEGASEALAKEIEPFGIKLTIVEPGPFRTSFAGKSLARSKNQIIDYKMVDEFYKKLEQVNNKQEGDPRKAAKILFDWIADQRTELRLPLGRISFKTIEGKLENIKNNLSSVKLLGESAVFD